jgi:uncharacterized ParB-like nuclease family protein
MNTSTPFRTSTVQELEKNQFICEDTSIYSPELGDSANQIIHLDLEEIRRNGGTQPRVKMDFHHIKRLCEQIEDGHALEPVVVFYDGEFYWLADGFHRWNAHKNQGEPTIIATVYQGTRRDAVLYSVGANADHKPALPRSREDKHRAVLTLFNDPEWGQWSDREIARQCKVSNRYVSNLRKALTVNVHSEKSERTYTTKHGTIATMNTANIGQSRKNRVTVKGDSVFEGQSGTIIQMPNPRQAIVELDSGERELIQLRHLLKEGTQIAITEAVRKLEVDYDSNSTDDDNSMTNTVNVPDTTVEINTDDICIAVSSNVEVLSLEQAQFILKSLTRRWSVDELLACFGK